MIQFIFGMVVFLYYMDKEKHDDWYDELNFFERLKLYFRFFSEVLDIIADLIYTFLAPHLTWWIASLLSFATFSPITFSIYCCYQWKSNTFDW